MTKRTRKQQDVWPSSSDAPIIVKARDMSRTLTLTLRPNHRFLFEVERDVAQQSMFATIVLSNIPETYWRVEQIGEQRLIGTFPIATALELSGTLYVSRQKPIVTRYQIMTDTTEGGVLRVGFLNGESEGDYASYIVRISEKVAVF